MINHLKTPLYNSLYNDYITDNDGSFPFFPPLSDIPWGKIVKTIKPDTAHFRKIKAILTKQNLDLTSTKAKFHRDQLSKPDSVILITGQQLGLLTSPLYTIYKLITTLKLVEELNDKFSDLSFVPVFWLESEDHDFQEINDCGILDIKFSPIKISYDGNDKGKVSVRHYELESSINDFISELRENLLETEFSTDLLKVITSIYKPGKNWVEASRDFLKHHFDKNGLLFFQPGHSEIKNISIQFFTQLLEESSQIGSAFSEVSNSISSKGYNLQVKDIPGKTFIHLEDNEFNRDHLYREGSSFILKDSKQKFTLEEAKKFIAEKPMAVSTSVVSRPVLQSWLLPVAAYIAGPAEIAYWTQLTGIFSQFNLTMPVLYPRASATIIEPKIERFIKKHNPDIEHIKQKKKYFVEDYYKSSNQKMQSNPFKSLETLLNEKREEFKIFLQQVDPTLLDSGNKTIDNMMQIASNLENRVIKAKEQKNLHLTGHLEQIHTAIFPDEVPQERYMSIVYFLNKYGPVVLEKLYNEIDHKIFDHQIIFI